MLTLTGLGELSVLIESWVAQLPVAVSEGTDLAAKAVHKRVTDTYGDASKLAPLEQSTQDERVALGYTPNDPLLRTGELLRDSVRIERPGVDTAIIGSSEPIAVYHEHGYANIRAGKMVQPRPVFRIAAAESAPIIEELAHETAVALFSETI